MEIPTIYYCSKKKIRKLIKPVAFYLPQFHRIPENDNWWGDGFTEWTNVKKAKPLFKGHYQPRVPLNNNYYDLNNDYVFKEQFDLATKYQIYGFCIYHYWFGNGKQILEMPITKILKNKDHNFPIMLCWANQTWKGHWFGTDNKELIRQVYPKNDIVNHFKYLVNLFEKDYYIKIDNKPVFVIYNVYDLPNCKLFSDSINEMAMKYGFNGIYLIAGNLTDRNWNCFENGFQDKISNSFNTSIEELLNVENNLIKKILKKITFNSPRIKSNLNILNANKLQELIEFNFDLNSIPLLVPNWDNSPRTNKGYIIQNSSPSVFERSFQFELKNKYLSNNFIFLKSWNEWAEGNYLEPDTITKYNYLEVIKNNICQY